MHIIFKGLSLFYVFGYCFLAPLDSDETPTTTEFDFESWPEDTYSFQFETPGQSRRESGFEKMTKDGRKYLYVEGSYSYIGSNSLRYTVDYYSDDKGYHTSKPKPTIEYLLDEFIRLSMINSTGEIEIDNRVLPPEALGLLLG